MKPTTKAGLWVLGLLIAAGLGFGVQVAAATAPDAGMCPYSPPDELGSYPSWESCWDACYALHGELLLNINWDPPHGCCGCLW